MQYNNEKEMWEVDTKVIEVIERYLEKIVNECNAKINGLRMEISDLVMKMRCNKEEIYLEHCINKSLK